MEIAYCLMVVVTIRLEIGDAMGRFQVSIRGRILTGVVAKLKMNRTAVIRRDYLHYVKKYNRYNY